MLSYEQAIVSRAEYTKKKEQICKLLDNAIEFYSGENEENKKLAFEKLKEDLINGEFSIVIIGEFSAGKSTLLNALMRKRILPSFSNETTATVNFLRGLDKSSAGEAGRVYYNDGNVTTFNDVSLDTIGKYVSTKGDDVANSVEHLDLFLDSEFLKDGVSLVDSPGLNGVADGHREITEQQILKSHASIFLFNSDHPGSKTDFEFLSELQNKVKTIIFVLNKVDNIKEYEGETVDSIIQTLKDNYKKIFPEATVIPEIWPVAADKALMVRTNQNDGKFLEFDEKLENFEDRLLSFLTNGEKAKQQLSAPIDKIISIAKESKEAYENQIQILSSAKGTEELEDQIFTLEETIKSLETKKSESEKSVRKNIDLSFREIREELSASVEKLKELKLKQINRIEDLDELLSHSDNFERIFKEAVHSKIANSDDQLREKMVEIIKMQYFESAKSIENELLSSKAEIKLNISSHLEKSNTIFEVGLKEMDEKSKKMEMQLAELKKEAEKLERDCYEAKKIEREQNKIKLDIETLKLSRETIESQMLPGVERYQRNEDVVLSRGGILGKAIDFIVGAKYENRCVTVNDDTAHQEAKLMQEQRLQRNENEINKLEQKLSSSTQNTEFLELSMINKKQEIIDLIKKFEKQEQEDKENIQKKYEREIRKYRNILSDFCDDITDELSKQVKYELRKSHDKYISTIMEIVEGNLKEEISNYLSKQAKLKEQLESSEVEKKERLQAAKNKIEQLNEMMSESANIQCEIESKCIDVINETEL